MKWKKLALSLVCVLFLLTAGMGFHVLSKINIEYLIVYDLKFKKPRFLAAATEFYIFTFRGNRKDMEYLNHNFGLNPLLADPTIPKERIFKYISFFLDKGFDINTASYATGLTLLHAAILDNNPEVISFLLEKNADPQIGVGYNHFYGKAEKSSSFGMNAIEMARHRSKTDKKDRSQIIQMLNTPIQK
ncbi:MAG: ankyrin repeat domain-containing protein [Desulfobacteraceae bacterium]|nr:ankyrin repeat domain-containing protein [Desulfobacteraceae bacterium]